MLNYTLANLIIYNFLQVSIRSVAIFNCWNDIKIRIIKLQVPSIHNPAQYTFTKLAADNYFYTQYINMDRNDSLIDIEHRYLKKIRPTMGIFLDMNCENSRDFLNMSSHRRLYNQHYHWQIFDNESNITNFRRHFLNANLSVDADLTFIMLNTEQQYFDYNSYILYDVYNNGRIRGGSLNMTIDREIICNVSNCQLGQYLSDLYKRSKYGNRQRLSDIAMHVSTVITKCPLNAPDSVKQNFLRSTEHPELDNIARYGFQLTVLRKDILGCNFTYDYTNIWGRNEIEGGVVGALVTETADFANTPFLLTGNRLELLSAITKTSEFRSLCVFRTPRNSGIKTGVFLEPFSTTVWIIFGVILVISALFLWSTFVVEYRRMHFCMNFVPSFLMTFLISFGSACVQGTDLMPRSIGGRMAFFSLSLITFLMYNYYTSIVVSSLLGSPVKSNIKTVGQLADSSLEVALEPIPYTFVYLNSTQVPEVRRFVKRKIEAIKDQNVWMNIEEGIKKVRDKPGFVFAFDASTGFRLVEKLYEPHEICDLNEILLRTDTNLHQLLNRNSTYKEVLRLRDLRIVETGVLQKHQHFWVHNHLNCFDNNFVINVGMEYCAPLFFLMMCAYILVIMVLIIEIIHKRYMDKRKERVMTYIEEWEPENDT